MSFPRRRESIISSPLRGEGRVRVEKNVIARREVSLSPRNRGKQSRITSYKVMTVKPLIF